MVSGSGIDRDRLTGGPGLGLGGILLVMAVLLLVGAGVWYVGFRSPGESAPVAAVTTTTSATSQQTTSTLEGQTTTTGAAVTGTTIVPVGDLASIPVLKEAEAYIGEQARLVWLPGSQSAWIVDMEAATAGRLLDVPPGPRGWGAPARDGSLIVEIGGRMLRRTPQGEWLDISPAGDRSYRILDTRTGEDHLHIYVIESGGAGDRLLNVMYRYNEPNALEEKWVADAADIVRLSASKAMQLVIVEVTASADGGVPRYLLLSEQSGRKTSRSSFPVSEDGSKYVWGLEFAGGSDLFYMQCEASEYVGCAASDGFIVNLSSGADSPVGDLYPGWSREWETPLGVPSFTNSFGGLGLLVRTNVDVGDLQSGDRGRLISARDY